MTTLTIRDAQLHVLGDSELRVFVEDAVTLAARHWPERSRALGDAGLRDRVWGVVRYARAQGVVAGRDVLRVLNVAMLADESFDPAPRSAWIRATLTDARFSAVTRVERLDDQARVYAEG